MATLASAPASTSTSPPVVSSERTPRDLTIAELRVKAWIKKNHGILSRVAREMDCSVTFVQRIAYNREAKSAGLKIEQRLRSLGCPLMQKIR